MDKMKGSIYLDYNATTPLEPEVVEAIHHALCDAWGNPSSCYDAGKKAKAIIENSREWIATMMGGVSQEVVFTSGGTESNNMVLQTAITHFHKTFSQEAGGKKLPHIITCNIEHPAIKLPLEQMEKEGVADVTFVHVSKRTGRVEAEDIIAAIRPTTILVTVMTANNETGVIQPIAEICERVRGIKRDKTYETAQIFLHTDAAQVIGKVPVDIDRLGADYYTIVGHKFYGPRIGAVYIKSLDKGVPLYPMFYGGGQERNYRPGTENTAMISGLGKAAELVCKNITNYETHLRKVRDYLEQRLKEEFPGKIHINGDLPSSERLPNTCNVSLTDSGLKGRLMLKECTHLQASVGAACHSGNGDKPSHILLATGIAPEIAINALRLSVGRATTIDDIDLVITDIKKAVNKLLDNDNEN